MYDFSVSEKLFCFKYAFSFQNEMITEYIYCVIVEQTLVNQHDESMRIKVKQILNVQKFLNNEDYLFEFRELSVNNLEYFLFQTHK